MSGVRKRLRQVECKLFTLVINRDDESPHQLVANCTHRAGAVAPRHGHDIELLIVQGKITNAHQSYICCLLCQRTTSGTENYLRGTLDAQSKLSCNRWIQSVNLSARIENQPEWPLSVDQGVKFNATFCRNHYLPRRRHLKLAKRWS